ncbi:MAG: hypothetical protein H7175_04610 [Burkholderiales bacterium]|nr:hypothetical protein [Anaerolineae bacterium]
MKSNSRRFYEVMIGLVLLLVGFGAFADGENFPLILLSLAGFYLLAKQFDQSRRSLPGSNRDNRSSGWGRGAEEASAGYVDFDFDDETADGETRTEQVYRHALKAVERAGMDAANIPVLPVDIGVMAFKSDTEPTIYRTRVVPDDIDYLQPFVQLRLPQKATGRVRFEIIDSDGQVMFIHEDFYKFSRGLNLVTPAARLPIHDAHAMSAEWQLRVTADDTLLALHGFNWHETSSRVMRRHMSEDGEVNSEIRAMVAESRLQKMSLDELLGDQEDEAPQQQSRK